MNAETHAGEAGEKDVHPDRNWRASKHRAFLEFPELHLCRASHKMNQMKRFHIR